MDVFLPREDKTVGEVLETLSGSHWQPEYIQTDVDLKLPRFETDTNQNLVGVMADLGMPKAFTFEADFPYFCNGEPYISNMFQVAKIKLDEEGTVAAAVTVIEMTESAEPEEPKPFHADRPFLYIISEQSTGTIFFIGQYMGEGVQAAIATPRSSGSEDAIYSLSGQRLNSTPSKGIYIRNDRKVMVGR